MLRYIHASREIHNFLTCIITEKNSRENRITHTAIRDAVDTR